MPVDGGATAVGTVSTALFVGAGEAGNTAEVLCWVGVEGLDGIVGAGTGGVAMTIGPSAAALPARASSAPVAKKVAKSPRRSKYHIAGH